MGLYQHMYAASKDANARTNRNSRELAYRRKHGDLHGWMQKLYASKTGVDEADEFNRIEVELTYDDVKALEDAVRHKQLPHTEGFFFGKGNTDRYYEDDLQFCVDAKAEIFLGFKVFYSSSW